FATGGGRRCTAFVDLGVRGRSRRRNPPTRPNARTSSRRFRRTAPPYSVDNGLVLLLPQQPMLAKDLINGRSRAPDRSRRPAQVPRTESALAAAARGESGTRMPDALPRCPRPR